MLLCLYPNCLPSVTEDTVRWISWRGSVELVKLPDHQVPLDGVKRGGEIHKEDPGKGTWEIQVLEEEVQQEEEVRLLV